MKTNKEKLVMQSVIGKIHSPIMRNPYRVDATGKARVLPATGGITYNFKIGDSCMGIVGDHVEPGASIRNEIVEENNAMMYFACVGNEATVVSGDAKGTKGYVTGMHGGIEHILVYFEKEELEKMAIDDKIQIKAWGQGLSIENFEDVVCMNLDPELFEKMGIKEVEGKLEVPVVTEVPAELMGSGLGSVSAFSGDYDITTGDKEAVLKYNIDKLKFGDIVLLKDCENNYGRQYLKGAVTIGVIVHSDSTIAGHGPGVATLLSCREEKIIGKIDEKANIGNYLKLK